MDGEGKDTCTTLDTTTSHDLTPHSSSQIISPSVLCHNQRAQLCISIWHPPSYLEIHRAKHAMERNATINACDDVLLICSETKW